ncbi:hypothetical protein F5884DRAFT_752603 [Xylogone sp. PMI_703]|nr:hypothetical protein F5884DRAFT_752603 [Xylogone sp. PMI_703]
MVITRPYYIDEEPAYQRGGGRSYLGMSEPSTSTPNEGNTNGSCSFKFASKESQGSHRNSEADTISSQPRRRIPVACGRCRKRKIRCSGDPGNGGACQNCKTAGNDVCQFLRVSSTEAQLKVEPTEFPYPGGNRHSPYRMMDIGLYDQQLFNTQISTDADVAPQSRTGTIIAQPFTNRNGYATIGSYSANYSDNVEYGVESGGYQMAHPHQVGFSQSSYCPSGTVRSWVPPQSMFGSNSLFVDSEGPYNGTPSHYSSDILRLHPTSSVEPEAFSSNILPPSIQAPIQMANNDRVLLPLPNRPAQVSSQYLKPDHNLQPINPSYSRQVHGNEARAVPSKPLKSNAENALMSMPQSYYSVPPSQDCPPSPQFDGLPAYTNSPASLFRDNSMRCESSELSYGYGPSTGSSKRGSASTQGTSNSSTSTLANGQQYVPHVQVSYPAPPMIEIGPAPVRRTAENLQAV